jgi:hypothetical protein
MTESETKRLQYQISVMQGFLDGKELHIRHGGGEDCWFTCWRPDWNWLEHEYRIKPEVVKYRRWLTTENHIRIVNFPEEFVAFDSIAWFSKWIDTEWQEVEI